MAVIFLIKILHDNRIELVDNHKKLTNTYKNQTCLRQALKNRLNTSKPNLATIMSQLLENQHILDDNPVIQSYINRDFLSTEQKEEITDLVVDQANNSYVSNYDYDIYKKKTDNQDQVISLLKKQLNDVVDKLDKLEMERKSQDIVSRLSKYENVNSDLQRDIVSLKSENRLLMDKINTTPSLCPIPEIDSVSYESIPESIHMINHRLDRIEMYLFND